MAARGSCWYVGCFNTCCNLTVSWTATFTRLRPPPLPWQTLDCAAFVLLSFAASSKAAPRELRSARDGGIARRFWFLLATLEGAFDWLLRTLSKKLALRITRLRRCTGMLAWVLLAARSGAFASCARHKG